MTQFNKIIAAAILFVTCNAQVAKAIEPAVATTTTTTTVAAVEPAVAAASKLAAEPAGWTFVGKAQDASNAVVSASRTAGSWCVDKGVVVVNTTKTFGTESIATIKANPKTSIAVAAVVVAGVSYVIYKRNQAKEEQAA